MAEDKVYLLTQEAYNKMKEELAHREGELREEIAHKIAVARAEGDLSENGGSTAKRSRWARRNPLRAASPSSPSSCAIPRSSRMLRKAPWARALW